MGRRQDGEDQEDVAEEVVGERAIGKVRGENERDERGDRESG
jgi:hypothetical protein